MKVIVAGLPKTGTKSVNAALKELGYDVYDFLENIWYLRDEWNQIMTKGGTRELFFKMYQNVDAVTDAPASGFWQEIHEAFPDAKIIHMTRENEEEWLLSMKHQADAAGGFLLKTLMLLSPSGYAMSVFADNIGRVLFGNYKSTFNKTLLLRGYRRHNSHILKAAPKDKLLIYNVKQGWKPLCEFLGHRVPSTPFPHKNVRGEIVKEVVAEHPVMKRLKLEMSIVIGSLVILTSFVIAKTGIANFLFARIMSNF